MSLIRTYNLNSHFPGLDTKTLKKLVRDIIDPSRDLGHVDRPKVPKQDPPPSSASNPEKDEHTNAAPAATYIAAENSFRRSREIKGEPREGERRPLAEPAQEQIRRTRDKNACEDCN